jgi:uncharacterized protein (TIGR03435 family)
MTNRMTQKLSAGRKALLVSAGVLAVAGPIAIGVTAPQLRGQSKATSTFEVTSVKPYKTRYPIAKGNPDLHSPRFLPGGRFTATAPLLMVIAAAYDIPMTGPVSRITGGPAWLNSPESVYDIQATAAKGVIPDGLAASARADRMRVMLQALLADRFKLVLRRETKEVPVYALVVSKDGPKIPKADIEEKDCPDTPLSGPATSEACHRFTGGRGRGLHARAVDMSDLVTFVQAWTDRPLVDKTGLKGLYHIETEPWLPMELGSSPPSSGAKQDNVSVADLPTLFTIFERLGLKMVPQKGNVDVYVIDRIEKPAEN